jgi:hypothetical protein
MSLTVKVVVIAALAVAELITGFVLWRKFMAEGKPQVAVIMVVQAVGTVFIFGVILFALVE